MWAGKSMEMYGIKGLYFLLRGKIETPPEYSDNNNNNWSHLHLKLRTKLFTLI